tara:strand:- start:972 stop:1178 length:207 start_codon:yes stop_codon:yes gene_type:complete
MKKLFTKLFKDQQIINYKTDMSEKAKQLMQERILARLRRRHNAPTPTTLTEPDLSFKEDEDPHFWRGK